MSQGRPPYPPTPRAWRRESDSAGAQGGLASITLPPFGPRPQTCRTSTISYLGKFSQSLGNLGCWIAGTQRLQCHCTVFANTPFTLNKVTNPS